MLCPCGCGCLIHLNLLFDLSRPRWDVRQEADGSATITPSIWRNNGCRSHFVLRHGRIRWC
ncbi:MAG: DUF6527 family protein [Verrucomicrobiota bacterium JB025]